MDWQECLDRRIVKDVNPDIGLINSLIKTSSNKLESEILLEMSEITAASKLSLAYDSLRELLEALAFKKGYKVYNHECYTAFLKEVVKEGTRAEEFDEIRKLRNDVNYYGKDITQKEAEEAVKRIRKLREFISDLIEK